MFNTFEEFLQLDSNDQDVIIWDWYKDYTGVRPHGMSKADALEWVKFMLSPEGIAAWNSKQEEDFNWNEVHP